MHRTRGRDRVRRVRKGLAAALVVAVLAAAVAGVAAIGIHGSGHARPRPAVGASSPPAPVLRTVALRSVAVHRGEKARLRYRLEASAGSTWTVTVAIVTVAGRQVKAQRLAGLVPAGESRTLNLLVNVPPGRYRYVVHMRDSAGREEAQATVAGLRVLRPLVPGFPSARNTAKAFAWAAGRSGQVAVGVVDTNGIATGYHEHETFQAASLAKAIILVAYLRSHRLPDPALDAVATKMIEESDNASANTMFAVVGSKGMLEAAKLAGMNDYKQGAGWIDTRVSAADEARLFSSYEKYLPAARRGFARKLLSGITRMQRWGIPAAAGPAGWKPYFKGGWLGLDNRLMVQAAWLEKGSRSWAVAVMSDDNPNRSYGWDTQKGVTGLLLGEEPEASYLATVLEY
jgi:hypothetical protein